MKLGNSPKLHIYMYSLSTPGRQTWAYLRSTGSGFQDTGRFSNLPYLGMKLGHSKVPEVAYKLSFYPRDSKLSLFSLYEQRFQGYGPIFKIAIFGQVPEVPQVDTEASPCHATTSASNMLAELSKDLLSNRQLLAWLWSCSGEFSLNFLQIRIIVLGVRIKIYYQNK